jgi:hypothetical protein
MSVIGKKNFETVVVIEGNHTIADLRYGEIDIIGPSTLIFAPIKG